MEGYQYLHDCEIPVSNLHDGLRRCLVRLCAGCSVGAVRAHSTHKARVYSTHSEIDPGVYRVLRDEGCIPIRSGTMRCPEADEQGTGNALYVKHDAPHGNDAAFVTVRPVEVE